MQHHQQALCSSSSSNLYAVAAAAAAISMQQQQQHQQQHNEAFYNPYCALILLCAFVVFIICFSLLFTVHVFSCPFFSCCLSPFVAVVLIQLCLSIYLSLSLSLYLCTGLSYHSQSSPVTLSLDGWMDACMHAHASAAGCGASAWLCVLWGRCCCCFTSPLLLLLLFFVFAVSLQANTAV